jgi:hypothetical protein
MHPVGAEGVIAHDLAKLHIRRNGCLQHLRPCRLQRLC